MEALCWWNNPKIRCNFPHDKQCHMSSEQYLQGVSNISIRSFLMNWAADRQIVPLAACKCSSQRTLTWPMSSRRHTHWHGPSNSGYQSLTWADAELETIQTCFRLKSIILPLKNKHRGINYYFHFFHKTLSSPFILFSSLSPEESLTTRGGLKPVEYRVLRVAKCFVAGISSSKVFVVKLNVT